MTAPFRVWVAVPFLLACLASMAHVGSPDTFFTGNAGPYPVRVTIRLPGVIPGLAQISVRALGVPASSIRSVTVQALQWNVGPEGAPPPDPAVRVPGTEDLYAADLWFMVPTSYRVHVAIDGTQGSGVAVVPVLALATEQRAMPRSLGVILSGLGVFLFLGLLTIVHSAVREGVLPAGEGPDSRRRTRARIATIVAALVLSAAVWGGKFWWDAEAYAYGNFVLYRPFSVETVVRTPDVPTLTLTIRDRRWTDKPDPKTRYGPLMPDHGKLMHMFLVREVELDAFAHVHPVARSQPAREFDLKLPPLPAGRYRVYADIVHESGYAQTLVSAVDVPASRVAGVSPGDPDDSWFTGGAAQESPSAVFRHPDGSTIVWERGPEPIVEREEHLLRFAARNPDGSAMALEPYMGMFGHAAVTKDDGSVFAHLHPSGSISMAALQKFVASAASPDPHAAHAADRSGSEISIPYAFPKSGRYRIWVQVKHAGEVMTSAFDTDVRPR